ncbi:CTTNBP2 [Scenedesmus sp. PABB004]|nr:CTTNBP2 [Scenedesmus sp. PABB004]
MRRRPAALVLLLVAAAALSPAAPAAAAAAADATARLEAAARANDAAAAADAIADGADLNARGGGGQTPIMAATLSGSTDVVRLLLSEHRAALDLSLGEQDGYTPLHGAGFQGRAEAAALLIAAGLDPRERHQDGYAPVHRACWGREPRHTETVRVLLEQGKVPVNELGNGQTPLDAALRSGNEGTIALLRARGGKTAEELAPDDYDDAEL